VNKPPLTARLCRRWPTRWNTFTLYAGALVAAWSITRRYIQKADVEHGTEGWTLHPAEEGSIAAKSFPRYGRIEGRSMGLISPPDPEHIGDTMMIRLPGAPWTPASWATPGFT
jgi:hypothetical protein